MISPSQTSGAEAARRSMAPSISTWSAPCCEHQLADRAHLLGGARPGDLDDAGLLAGAPPARARAACGPRSPTAARTAAPLARSSSSVVASRLPAGSATRGLSMRASITSCSSPSRPTEVTPDRCALLLELAQEGGERDRLAGVLGQPDERHAPGGEGQLAEAHRRRRVRPSRASARPARGRGRSPGAAVRSLSRTPRRSRAPWPARWSPAALRRRGSSAPGGPRPRPSRRAR